MSRWFRDPRGAQAVAQAEADAFEARRPGANSPALWLKAAEGLAEVAVDVRASHPSIRNFITVSAAASFARAGRADLAAAFARRMLGAVGAGSLAADVRAELARRAGAPTAT